MIGTIRKHQQWLWIIIITVTIVTFVGFLSPSSRMNSGGGEIREGDFGTINSQPIKRDDFVDAQREEQLFFFLHYREPATEDKMRQVNFDLTARTYQRLVMLAKLKELKVDVTPAATARMTREIFGVPADQALPAEALNNFLQTIGRQGLSMDDFERFVRHQVGQQHLITVFGMAGKFITDKEAEFYYRRENEPIICEVASFPVTNYLSKVTVQPKDLEDFFKKNQAEYYLPERVQVNYVKFEATNFMAEADKDLATITNLNQIIDQIYYKDGAASFKDDKGKQLSMDDARAKIRKQLREESALRVARKKAGELINDLYQGHEEKDNNPFTADDLEKVAKAQKLEAKTTEPFDRSGPKSIKVPETFVRVAFSLRDDDPEDKTRSEMYPNQPIMDPDKNVVYVIGLKKRFPSQAQTLDQVRSKATEDYRRVKAYELVKEAGDKFQLAATNGLAAGKTFTAICAENNIKPTVLPAFSLATETAPEPLDKTTLRELQRAAYQTPTGKSSIFVPTMEGGFVAFVKERLAIDPAKQRTELPNFVARLREQRMNSAYADWFNKTWKDMNVVVPQQMQKQSAARAS